MTLFAPTAAYPVVGRSFSFSGRLGFDWRPFVHPPHPRGRLRPPVSSSLCSPSWFRLRSWTRWRRSWPSGPFTRPQNVSRLDVAYFRCPKEGRRMEANHQLEVAQQNVSCRSPLPDGHRSGCGGPSSPRRLLSVDQLEGCLLPRPRQSPLPSLRLERPSLRVYGSSIKTLPGPSHFYHWKQSRYRPSSTRRGFVPSSTWTTSSFWGPPGRSALHI